MRLRLCGLGMKNWNEIGKRKRVLATAFWDELRQTAGGVEGRDGDSVV